MERRQGLYYFLFICKTFYEVEYFLCIYKTYFSKSNTSYNVSIIRLLRILHKTLSRPPFRNACVLKRSTSINHLKNCVQNIFGDTQTDHVELQQLYN